MRRSLLTSFAAAAALTVGSYASAATVPYAGTLAATPTFNRPLSLTGLSGSGSAVGYTVLPFVVDLTGGYTITQATPTYDGYLLEYQTAFSPAAPLANLINGDDDFGTPAANASQIAPGDATNFAATNTLTAGTQYFIVSTSFSNGASGAFTGTVTGPGTATFTNSPEPASLGLLAMGGAALIRRRRRA